MGICKFICLEYTGLAEGVPIDKIDLQIMRLLSANCRIPYRTISSTLGISTNAVKARVKNMLDKGIIQRFITVINPAIFGYETQCILIVRNSDKIITKEKQEDEGYIFNQLSLFGDIWAYTTQLGGTAIFLVLLRPDAENKIELLDALLKPADVEYKRIAIIPPSMNISITDLKIIKCLLSNARMELLEIAKENSISHKTVTRRIEKMQERRILDFSIIRDMSSMNLAGFIEFLLVGNVDKSAYKEIIERIYAEMQEYLILIPPNISGRSELIITLFICSNISTVDSIAKRIKTYGGVQSIEIFITTKVIYHQEWLERQINKRLELYPNTAATTTGRLPDVE